MSAAHCIAIENATIVLENSYIFDGVLQIEEGKIVSFGTRGSLHIPPNATRIDANGCYLGPGLIDIHAHAGGEHPFAAEPVAAAQHMLRHGVTSVLATLYYELAPNDFVCAIDRINAAMDSGAAPNIKGFYMEGPYMNPRYGAFADQNQWKGPIAPADYIPLLEHAGTRAKVWAIAPEREGIRNFVEDARRFAPDAIFSVGHSEASAEQVEALMPLGLCLATHHTNAIGNPPRHAGCHRPGIEDAVYANDAIYAELIVDSIGIHVAPYLLRLIVSRLKRRDRLILISDATAFRRDENIPDAGADLSFDENGDLAGSRLTLEVACRNMIRHTGASIADAFRYASTNPARLLGFHSLGAIAAGKTADLVCVDDTFHVNAVFLHGEPQFCA